MSLEIEGENACNNPQSYLESLVYNGVVDRDYSNLHRDVGVLALCRAINRLAVALGGENFDDGS